MAEELRGVQYQDGSAADVSGAELLTNNADADLYIRAIHITQTLDITVDNMDYVHTQIGKNNALDSTDGAHGVKFQHRIGCKNDLDGGPAAAFDSKSWYLAKGQFVLEPGETLYYNKDESGTPAGYLANVDVWYHF